MSSTFTWPVSLFGKCVVKLRHTSRPNEWHGHHRGTSVDPADSGLEVLPLHLDMVTQNVQMAPLCLTVCVFVSHCACFSVSHCVFLCVSLCVSLCLTVCFFVSHCACLTHCMHLTVLPCVSLCMYIRIDSEYTASRRSSAWILLPSCCV